MTAALYDEPSPAQPSPASLKTLIHIIISSRPAITTFTTNHNTLSTLTTSGGFQRFSLLLQRPKYQIDPIPPKASDATGNGCGYSPRWWWPRSRPPSAWSRWSTSLQSEEWWVKDMEGREVQSQTCRNSNFQHLLMTMILRHTELCSEVNVGTTRVCWSNRKLGREGPKPWNATSD